MHGLNNAQLPLTVGILVFDQVEVLDVAGPFEVFTVTRLNKELRQEESSPSRVLLVSENMDQVSAVGGLLYPQLHCPICLSFYLQRFVQPLLFD